MTNLTKELQDAVRDARAEPLRLLDPGTNVEYVLLRAEIYDRLQSTMISDGILTKEERRQLLIDAGKRAGWDDPEMDIYDALDPRRQP